MLLDLLLTTPVNAPPQFQNFFEIIRPPFNASNQQFSTFEPLGSITAASTATPTVFTGGYPLQLIRRVLHQGTFIAPQPPPVVTPEFAQSPDLFGKLYKEHQFGAFVPFGAFVVPSVFAKAPDLFSKTFIDYQLSGFEGLVATAVVTTTPQEFSQSPDILTRLVNAAQHPFSTFEPLGTVSFAAFQPLPFTESPQIIILGVSAAQQQYGTNYLPQGLIPTPPTPQGWMQQQPNSEILIQAYNAVNQQFGTFGPAGFIAPPPVQVLKPSWLVMARRRGRR